MKEVGGGGHAVKAAGALVFAALMPAMAFCAATDECRAQAGASATAEVVVHVKPVISVEAKAAVVDAGTVPTGDVTATVGFRVNASAPTVAMYVGATDLHGTDGAGGRTAGIPLAVTRGATITPADATPVGNGTVAHFTGLAGSVADLPGRTTECLSFQIPGQGCFRQDVHVTVSWRQEDAGVPAGDYSGRVQLVAMILP